ncbi:hypothetical protein A2U01_0113142, partial [Trifolium medium]|nr:hypothetical protein [Trifolium medium]
ATFLIVARRREPRDLASACQARLGERD